MALPRVSLEGGLVRDPELRFTQAGKAWASCRVATKDRVRGADGQWTDGPATFIDVVCFGRIAENLAESAAQGDLIVVEGRLQQNDYEKQDGTKVTSYRIVADSIGVALTFGAAKTARVSGDAPAARAAAADDPWAAPAADDAPPF
jgi:single-strand DNA-binding protein